MPRDKPKEWPRRPPRLGRLFDNVRPLYFVTFNTSKRESILARDEVHEAFCMFCTRAQEHDVAVGRYVIMPDHIHLFVAFNRWDGLAQVGSIAAQRDWKEIGTARNLQTALARRLFRSSFAQPRKLLAEMGVCAHEPGASKAMRPAGVLAISG
jgi:hypothetical protein